MSPGESAGVETTERVDQRDTRDDRLERAAVGDVNLAAAARLLCVLLERRLEARRTKIDATEGRAVHLAGKTLRVNPGRAHELERPRRPASFREHRSLE